jgi:hypothetical protein
MNAQDLELIKTIAGQVMGWTVLDKPIELSDTPGQFFFIADDKPFRATAHETHELFRQHGGPDYGLIWDGWNPLEEANAWREVLQTLLNQKTVIDIHADMAGFSVAIRNKDATIRHAGHHQEIGPAICCAALEFSYLVKEEREKNEQRTT